MEDLELENTFNLSPHLLTDVHLELIIRDAGFWGITVNQNVFNQQMDE